MEKQIKISIKGRSKTNHYADEDSGSVCSGCYHLVETQDRYCWYCGSVLAVYSHSGNQEYIAESLKRYQESDKTQWEKDDDD